VDEGNQVIGIRRGWDGLLRINPDDLHSREELTIELNKQNTHTINRTGGTILHTNRINPVKVRLQEAPVFLRGPDFNPDAKETTDFSEHLLVLMSAWQSSNFLDAIQVRHVSYHLTRQQSIAPLSLKSLLIHRN